MSEIWIPAAGGGADLDVVTAQAGDVRNGKVIVGPDGEHLTGTMKEISGGTITPTTAQQTLNGEGYLVGNIVVPGFTPPPANALKKGFVYQIFGTKITGTFEGWVPGNNDLYYRGNNIAGFKDDYGGLAEFQSDRIYIQSKSGVIQRIISANSYNLAKYKRIDIKFTYREAPIYKEVVIELRRSNNTIIAEMKKNLDVGTTTTYSLDISSSSDNVPILLWFRMNDSNHRTPGLDIFQISIHS